MDKLKCIISVIFLLAIITPAEENFLVGTGIYDITGPAGEIGMMGFARIDQQTGGIHTRLWSRAYVIEANKKRVVFVNTDLWAITQAVKLKVVEKLQKRYGQTYNLKNVMLSSTHTHSGPGGYSHYTLYNITILGFCEQNFNVIVDGIYHSIIRAHNNVAPAKIFVARKELHNAAVNRSLKAYEANTDANLHPSYDPMMTLLRIERLDGKEIGMICWFGVHTTSIFYGTDLSFDHPNTMISSDNKGWAERKFESMKKTNYFSSADTFVAAFANSTLGDTSPNVNGGQNGGGVNDYASNNISGDKQLQTALALYNGARRQLRPNINYRHTFTDFSKVTVAAEYTHGEGEQKTAYAAIGVAFLAGAEDGPSKIPFIKEGQYKGKYHSSHGTKPIFLETGKMNPPWTPEVLSTQLFVIGDLAILAVPGEFTTHSGRRIMQTVKDDLTKAGVDTMVISGPANAYAGYVATREEYNAQHYEGASTHFGQWTLAAFRQQFKVLSESLVANTIPDSGPMPRDLSDQQTTMQPGVVFDSPPFGKGFGDLVEKVDNQQRLSVMEVTFWGAHPRNTLKTQDSFFRIEKKNAKGKWQPVRYDYDLDTAFIWQRHGLAASKIKVMWDIPGDVAQGTYRVYHSGKYKDVLSGKVKPYSGYSNEFAIGPCLQLKIARCDIQEGKITFAMNYPLAIAKDLVHKTKTVTTGKIRFTVNDEKRVYEALPNKGTFLATLPKTKKIEKLSIPAGFAQDAYSNSAQPFSKKFANSGD